MKKLTSPTLFRRKLLRELREVTGLSLDELAASCGLSKSMLSKFELGHRELSPEAFKELISKLKGILAGLKEGRSASTKKARPTAFDKKLEQVIKKAKDAAREKEINDGFWTIIVPEAEKHRTFIIEVLKLIVSANEVSPLNDWLIAEMAASRACTVARSYTHFVQPSDREAMRLLTELLGPEEKAN